MSPANRTSVSNRTALRRRRGLAGVARLLRSRGTVGRNGQRATEANCDYGTAMARCRCSLDLGPRATVGQFSRLIADISTLIDVALTWANLEVAHAARRQIERLASYEPQGLSEQLIEADTDDADTNQLRLFSDWRRLQERLINAPWDMYLIEWERLSQRYGSSRRYLLPPPFPVVGPVTLERYAPQLFDRLVAVEFGEQRPGPVIVESASYANPLDVILAGAAGVVGGSVGKGTLPRLLEIARDWSADRRIALANATKAEQEAELAKLVLEAVSQSQGPTAEEVTKLLANGLDAIARIGETQPTWEELSDRDEDGS